MARKGGNPGTYFQKTCSEEIVDKVIGVKLPSSMDKYVRSLPNRAEWLRKAIAAQIERDLSEQNCDTQPAKSVS